MVNKIRRGKCVFFKIVAVHLLNTVNFNMDQSSDQNPSYLIPISQLELKLITYMTFLFIFMFISSNHQSKEMEAFMMICSKLIMGSVMNVIIVRSYIHICISKPLLIDHLDYFS